MADTDNTIELPKPELPTKKTLDDIERFGIEFSNTFVAIKNLIHQTLANAKRYIVVAEEFDGDGVRTGYTFHPNISPMYTPDEKANMLAYYDFLKETEAKINSIEYMNGLSFYDILNSRAKLDQIIAATLSQYISG